MIIGLGIGIPFGRRGGFKGVLDLYPNAAMAYSLRKLRKAYTGAAVRIRRSSDNAETDIGFLANGDFDSAAAVAFCGVGNGFITTWYDQSGNSRNQTQTTAANQPQIINSGVILTFLSKPSALFNGTSSILNGSNSTYSTSEQYYIVGEGFGVSGRGAFTIRNSSFWRDNATRFRILNGGNQYYTTAQVANNLLVVQLNPLDGDVFLNDVAASETGSISPTYTNSFSIGGAPAVGSYHNSYISEVIMWENTTDRTGKQNQINSFYGIY
jgi:hypothetical protein